MQKHCKISGIKIQKFIMRVMNYSQILFIETDIFKIQIAGNIIEMQGQIDKAHIKTVY